MTSSPWSADEMREQRLQWIKGKLPPSKESPTVIAIDSTFVHHTSEKIHGVYWYWDYAQNQFCLAQRTVISSLVTPSTLLPLGSQIYHRGFLPEQKLYLEATKPGPDATLEEQESFKDLVEQYEKNRQEHKTQLQIAGELVDECERQGFTKDAYVLDGAFLDKDLMGRIRGLWASLGIPTGKKQAGTGCQRWL